MPTVNLTLTGQAFASVNDTNVTLTLGGTPATALLKGVSITAGWTGQLSVARGGTGLGALGTANQLLRVNALGTALEYFTPSYGTGTVTSFAFTDSTGITGSVLNATTTPTLSLSLTSAAVGLGNVENTALSTWAGTTNVTTLGTIATGVWQGTVIGKAYGGTGVNIATTALTLGTASSAVGSIVLQNATNANTITIQSGVTTSSHTLTLPVANASGVLTNNGSGTLTWAAASSGITVGTTTSTGANGRLLFSLSGVVNESASVYIDQSGTNFDVRLGRQIGAGGVGYTGSSNVLIGHWVGYNMTSGGDNVFIGNGAAGVGSSLSNGGENVAVGSGAMNNAGNQFYTTAIGYRAGYGSTPFRGVYVGHNAGNGNANQGIIIGFDPPNTTAAHQCIIGSNDANGYISDYYFNGVTHTAPYSVVLHATHGSGTNVNAANMTLSGGAATGTGAGGYVKTTTSVKRASGTTVQSDTDRNIIVAKYVDITGGAATTFGQLALATSSTTSGGEVMYTIEANDGTDFQSLTGVLKYDVVNKAGALTVTYSDVQNGAGACSAGTLTATVTATASGTNVLFQANAVSSLSETVLRVSFQVINNFGVATITPA